MAVHVSARWQAKWTAQQLSSYSYLVALARRSLISEHISPGDGERTRWRNDPARAETIPTAAYASRLRLFVHLCRDFGIEPVMMTEPLAGAANELTPAWADLGAQDRFNELIRTIGNEENAAVIDLANHVKRNVPDWEKPMTMFYDGMHVTDRGSRIYAEYVVERLIPLIEKRRAAKLRANATPKTSATETRHSLGKCLAPRGLTQAAECVEPA
jgi:hypothetical protein